MRSAPVPHVAGPSDDAELVRRALSRDDMAFRTIMERYNRRLYRIARGILRDKVGVERCVLGGNSLGGNIAWETAHAIAR
jgi:RNA polymerase sigma-70 factor, ECF subfamily